MKPPSRSRTLWANVAIVGLAVWFYWSDFYVSPLTFVVLCAGVNIWLRFVTREPIGISIDDQH